MSGKKMKRLRKLLELKRNRLQPTEFQAHGTKQVAVIDGVAGNHFVEEQDNLVLSCDENKRLYRKLKKELKDNESGIGKELKDDLSNTNEGSTTLNKENV